MIGTDQVNAYYNCTSGPAIENNYNFVQKLLYVIRYYINFFLNPQYV